MTAQEDLRHLIALVRSDLATCKDELNRRIDELSIDLANSKEHRNQRAFAGPAMTGQEELRHLIEQNHKQIQRQFQEVQVQINGLHAKRYSGSLEKDSATNGVLPYCYGSRHYFGTILWALAIVALIFGCSWNLRELLKDMMGSPTVTKMTFTFHDKLPLLPISVHQFSHYKSFYTPMLDAEKLFKALENGSLTEAYLEAIINGVYAGLFFEQNITVQPNEITEAYKEAILRYGSLTEAGLAFFREYGIACDELFAYCEDDLSLAMNCCAMFEFLWGFNGPQYALKWNTIFLDAFQEFKITLRSLPNLQALQKGDFVEEPGNYQSYWIIISNGVDQTGYDTHALEVQPAETVTIMLRQKRRNLKLSKDCVDFPPKLRYFRDYTIDNCFIERCVFDKLSLCNISCEIPLLQLLNPDNHSHLACEYDVINATCRDLIQADLLQCRTNHGCRFPCNYTEVEYSVTKLLPSAGPREILLHLNYDTTEVQAFEETSRLTQWECLGLITSVLDLWLGITIFSLHRLLHRGLSMITYFKPYDPGKNNLAAAHPASAKQQPEMANLSNAERDRRIRSSTATIVDYENC